MKNALLSLMGIGFLVFAVAAGAHEPPGEITLAVNFPPGNEPVADGRSLGMGYHTARPVRHYER